eukprot:jgi/Psemu1/283744/fgenesh1_pg.33_\
MGKKGKGRQSGGFASKSLRATQNHEVQRIRDETLHWTRRETSEFVAWTSRRQQERLRDRPRFVLSLRRNLTGILNERRSRDAHLLRERRRRNGFLPSEFASGGSGVASPGLEPGVTKGPVHPPGWLIRYETATTKRERDDDSDSDSSTEYARPVETLQALSLVVFASYIRDYRDAMGDSDLYGVLSMLPPESRSELSILLSSGSSPSKVSNNASSDADANTHAHAHANTNPRGVAKKTARDRSRRTDRPPPLYMDNDLAMLLGQHSDVESLCLGNRKKADGRNTLTRTGLEALIPQNPILLQRRRGSVPNRTNNGEHDKDGGDGDYDYSSSELVPDCWDDEDEENCDDEYDDHEALYRYEGNGNGNSNGIRNGSGNLKLRRLELLDLNGDGEESGEVGDRRSMASVLVRWFEKCSGITHLSLAGSFAMHHEVGRAVVLLLPSLLPVLEVLDVTRCPWATDSMLSRVLHGYHRNPVSLELPTVYYVKGVFVWEPLVREGIQVEADPWEDPHHDGGDDDR